MPVKPVIGEVISDIRSRDVRGTIFSLSRDARDKIALFAFIGVDCPLAQLYVPRLVEIAHKYRPKGVIVLLVDSNRQDSVAKN